eukprot:2303143-Pyramimonas_sp.AAC.1
MEPRSAVLGGGDAFGPRHWVAVAHADPAAVAFGGAPYGAAKRCPRWRWRTRTLPLEPPVELPMVPRT